MSTPQSSVARLTYDDFMLFPDDGLRHEIIDGVHYVTPSPLVRHQVLVGRLHLAIGNFLAAHPELGRVFLSPLDVVLSYHDVVVPDLLFIAGSQVDILTEQNVRGAPALVIEILSKGTRRRDETIKKDLFERTGVQEYWLVDPKRQTLRAFRLNDDGEFAQARELTSADTLMTSLLPGFSLTLAALFAAD